MLTIQSVLADSCLHNRFIFIRVTLSLSLNDLVNKYSYNNLHKHLLL